MRFSECGQKQILQCSTPWELKETLPACTPSTILVNFNSPPLTMIAPLMQDSLPKRGKTNELSSLRFCHLKVWLDHHSSSLPTDSRPTNALRSKLVYQHHSPDSSSHPVVGSFKLSPWCHQSSQCSRCYPLHIASFSVSFSTLLPSWSFQAKCSTLPLFHQFHSVFHPSSCSQPNLDICLFLRSCFAHPARARSNVPSFCRGVSLTIWAKCFAVSAKSNLSWAK